MGVLENSGFFSISYNDCRLPPSNYSKDEMGFSGIGDKLELIME